MKKIDVFPEALFLYLIDIPLFSQIDPADLGDLPIICDLFSFEQGEKIIVEGEVNTSLFTLLSGEVEILKKGQQKEEIVLNTLSNGAIFGEASLFKDQPSTATVRTKELTLIMSLSRERFSSYINSHPKAGLVILTFIIYGLLEKLRSTNEALAFEKEFLVSSSDLEVMKSLLPPTLEDILS